MWSWRGIQTKTRERLSEVFITKYRKPLTSHRSYLLIMFNT